MASKILELKNISFSYPDCENKAIDGVSFDVCDGDFILLGGTSGCGKSTLLRLLKPEIAPFGTLEGEICFRGNSLQETEERVQVESIGFVLQNPDNQIVCHTVYEELYFGLENLGVNPEEIKRRVAEMVSYFGIGGWFGRKTSALSGGQKQILNLAAVMTMNPSVLLLDEPTSQLDPISERRFIQLLQNIHSDFGTTIIMAEHRFEQVLPICTKALILEHGKKCFGGISDQLVDFLYENKHEMRYALPACTQLAYEIDHKILYTVKQARNWFSQKEIRKYELESTTTQAVSSQILRAKHLCFQYGRKEEKLIRDLSFGISGGRITALVGANGSGKSTLLSLLGGTLKKVAGSIHCDGRIVLLPQNPRVLFTKDTVEEQLENVEPKWIDLFGMESLRNRHPYDLSGGEQAKLAMLLITKNNPDVYLLDEPEKGMDQAYKREFGTFLKELTKQGKTIVLVSHDLEFCSQFADEVKMMFQGELVYEGSTREFFGNNQFYTTMAARIAKGYADFIVTNEDVKKICQKINGSM